MDKLTVETEYLRGPEIWVAAARVDDGGWSRILKEGRGTTEADALVRLMAHIGAEAKQLTEMARLTTEKLAQVQRKEGEGG